MYSLIESCKSIPSLCPPLWVTEAGEDNSGHSARIIVLSQAVLLSWSPPRLKIYALCHTVVQASTLPHIIQSTAGLDLL